MNCELRDDEQPFVNRALPHDELTDLNLVKLIL